MIELDVEDVIRKVHRMLLGDRYTGHLAGPLSMGQSRVDDEIKTAMTDGLNKVYGRAFLKSLPLEEQIGIVMHEAVHILLRHIQRHRDLISEDAQLANVAMDYADNAYIMSIQGYGKWFRLPSCALHNKKFDNWTVRQIYKFLKEGRDPDQQPDQQPDVPKPSKDAFGKDKVTIDGKDYRTEQMDSHDPTTIDGMSDEEISEFDKKLTKAINECAVLAGVLDSAIPRQILEQMTEEQNWKEVTQDFTQSHMRGNDEHTFSKFNRKRIADNIYRPGKYTERLGTVILANDTSGSIGEAEMGMWMNWMAHICEQCNPDEVRVLWWGS